MFFEDNVPFFHVWFTTKDDKPLLSGAAAAKARGAMQQTADSAKFEIHAAAVTAAHVHLVLHLSADQEVNAAVQTLQAEAARSEGLAPVDLWAPTFRWQRVPLSDLARVVQQVTNAASPEGR